MNILIFNTFQSPPHFLGISLEFIQNSIDAGHKVYYVTCNSSFDLCGFNTYKLKYMCEICKSRGKKGLELIAGDFQKVNLSDIINEEDKKFALEYFNNTETFSMESIYEDLEVGSAVYSSLISKTRERDFSDKKEIDILKELAINSIKVYTSLKRFIKSNSISKVMVFNGRWDYYRSALAAAKKELVKVEVFEYFRKGGYYQLYGQNLPHNIKNYERLVNENWDNEQDLSVKSQIAEEFFEKKRKGITNYDRVYTKDQIQNELPSGFDETKRTFVLFNSSDDEFASLGEEWKNPLFKDQVEGILYLINFFKEQNDFQLIVRMHPNLKGLKKEYLDPIFDLENQYENILIVKPEDPVDSYHLMHTAEKVITFGSSTTIEANVLNKPVILLGKAFFLNSEVAHIPNSQKQIIELLTKDVEPKSKLGALKFGYYYATGGIKANFFDNVNSNKGYFKNVPLHESSLLKKIKIKLLKLLKVRN
jgi:hypothetical protein